MSDNTIFASNEPVADRYLWTEDNYLRGLEILGQDAPTKAMFNALFRNADEKIADLDEKIAGIDTSQVIPELQSVSQQVSDLDTKADALSTQYSDLSTTVSNATSQITTLSNNVSNNTAIMNGLESDITYANNANSTNSTNLQSVSADVQEAKDEADTNKTTIETAIAGLQSLIVSAQNAINNANAQNPSAILMVQRNTHYHKGDILYMEGLPNWAMVEYDYTLADNLETGAIAPDVSNVTQSGVRISDGNVMWIVRNKNLIKHKGAIHMLSCFGNTRQKAQAKFSFTQNPEVDDILYVFGIAMTFVGTGSSNTYDYPNKTVNVPIASSLSTTMSRIADALYQFRRETTSPLENAFTSSNSSGTITVQESDYTAGLGYNPNISFTGNSSILTITDVINSGVNGYIEWVGSGILKMNGVICNDWALMNGNNGTVDTYGKYFKVASNNEAVGTPYGSNIVTFTADMIPAHRHGINVTTRDGGNHAHAIEIPATSGANTMGHSDNTVLACGNNTGYVTTSTINVNTDYTNVSHTHTVTGETDNNGSQSEAYVSIEPAHICILPIQQII